MAALPTTNTNRLVIDYTWRGMQYSTVYRTSPATNITSFIGALNLFHQNLRDRFYDTWFVLGTGVYYLAGETFSNPATGITAWQGEVTPDPLTHPDSYQVQVLGRTPGGRRASWYYQGFAWLLDANQRRTGAESDAVADLLARMQILVDNGLVAINNQTPVLKPYINIVFNDYLTRRARGG